MNIEAEKILLTKLISETTNEAILIKIKELFIAESDGIPDWHKDIVLKRAAEAKPADFISWGTAQKQLTHN